MSRYSWAVGLEDQDVSDVDLSALENPQNCVEANSIECAEATSDLDTLQQDGEQLAGDTTQLEEIAGAVESAEAEGGMDETAARVVDVAVESIAQRWGVRRRRLGLESFNSANKSRGTRVALEEVGEVIKSLWERFIAWVGEIIDRLKDFWLKYFNAGKSIQKRADKLEDRLAKGLGERSKEKIGGSWAKNLLINGRIDVDHCVSKGIDKSKLSKAMDRYIAGQANAVAGSGDSKPVSEAFSEETFGVKATKSLKEALPGDAEVLSTIAIPSIGYVVKYKHNNIERLKKVALNEYREDKTVATPDVTKMSNAIKAIRAIGEGLEETLKDFRGPRESLSTLRDAARAASKDANDKKGEDRQKAIHKRDIAQAAVSNALILNDLATAVPMAVANGLIGYVQDGVSAHKSVKA